MARQRPRQSVQAGSERAGQRIAEPSDHRRVPATMGPPDQHLLDSDPRRELLRRVTGREPVRHGRHVRTDDALASVERIHLVERGGAIVVAFWPAELKEQARDLYDHGRETR
jgi:hypothetical protein